MKVLHKAAERGGGEHGWLSTRHSFSFADWYEPSREGFGCLRVLNDDTLAPHSGFPMHPHRDMEIVTVVMKGTLTHEDSMGNRGKVRVGEVQVMSAGRGVVHSESNESDEPLHLFQIWIETDMAGHEPRYDQRAFGVVRNELQRLVAKEGVLFIHQDARIFRGDYEAGTSTEFLLIPGKGAYVFVIDGCLEVAGEVLKARDALGITDVETFSFTAREPSTFLLIEVPMR